MSARRLFAAAAGLALALSGCARASASAAPAAGTDSASEELLPSSVGVPNGAAKPRRVPKRKDLPCFQCHDFAQFEKGPPFPHETDEHRSPGHCSVCHESLGHEKPRFSKAPCLGCHDEEQLREIIPNLPTGEDAATDAPAP